MKKKNTTELSSKKAIQELKNSLDKKVENYLTITKTTKNTECYTIIDIHPTYIYNVNAEQIKKDLEIGTVNLTQHGIIEPYLWVVNGKGERIATLSKQGGDSSEDIIIEVK